MGRALHEENRDSLFRRMREGGFDFSRFYPIEFYAVFPDEQKAREATRRFRGESMHAQVSEREDGVWSLQVCKVMSATSNGIGDFEQDLESVVIPLGGELDGWGVTQEARP
ncbi:ribonuclease E inhibitor RraB [Ectopseudomonas mendocina]|uniref:Ribonuclease E inhibitor RraB n=1 Tax=Ectopseudomonas mendocina TaxID=300 RepID=A0ABZ2RIY2_ECTME